MSPATAARRPTRRPGALPAPRGRRRSPWRSARVVYIAGPLQRVAKTPCRQRPAPGACCKAPQAPSARSRAVAGEEAPTALPSEERRHAPRRSKLVRAKLVEIAGLSCKAPQAPSARSRAVAGEEAPTALPSEEGRHAPRRSKLVRSKLVEIAGLSCKAPKAPSARSRAAAGEEAPTASPSEEGRHAPRRWRLASCPRSSAKNFGDRTRVEIARRGWVVTNVTERNPFSLVGCAVGDSRRTVAPCRFLTRGTRVAQPPDMVATNAAALGKIICFHCRRTDCVGPCDSAPRKLRWVLAVRRSGAWLGGAWVAGTALGAALALLLCR